MSGMKGWMGWVGLDGILSGSGSAVVRDDDRARPREPVLNRLVYPRSSPTASATTRRPWARGLAGGLLGAGTRGWCITYSRRLSWEDGMSFFGFWRFSDERCLRVGWTLYYILAPLVRLYDALLFMEDVIMKRPRLEALLKAELLCRPSATWRAFMHTLDSALA